MRLLPVSTTTTSLMSTRFASSYYDAVIVGGGMVGNAMGCTLGANKEFQGKTVLMLDAGKKPKVSNEEKYSNRVVAVAPTSIGLFEKLGVWDRIESTRVGRVNKLCVFDSCSTSNIHFDRPQHEEVAYIIENDLIVAALFEKMTSYRNVDVRTSVKVAECTIPNSLQQMATVKLDNGDVIETALLIGADGNKSKVREASDVEYTSWNYNQSAIVATLEVECPNHRNDIAWQRFLKNGPVALLPLTDKLSGLTWTTTPEEASRLKNLPGDQFVDELNNALFSDADQNAFINQSLFAVSRLVPPFLRRETFGRSETDMTMPHVIRLQSDNRAFFPLGFGNAHSYIATRCALIGDAAHRVHPLAGQGVNLGWNDVLHLNKVISSACQEGADIGSVTYLREYDSVAQKHNVPIMVSIDILNRLYRTTSPAVVAARSFGLSVFNSLTPVKDMITGHLSTVR